MSKHLRLLILAGLVALTLGAQRTRVELAKPTTPEQDSKPSSSQVSDVYAPSGQFERVVVLRFNYHVHFVSNRTFPSKKVFYKDPASPADIISINGYVINGRVHAHMTLTDGSTS